MGEQGVTGGLGRVAPDLFPNPEQSPGLFCRWPPWDGVPGNAFRDNLHGQPPGTASRGQPPWASHQALGEFGGGPIARPESLGVLSLSPDSASPTGDGCLLMLGRDHREYGVVSQASLGRVNALLSVGSDPHSPSLASKGDKLYPNEDALLVKRQGHFYLLAVSDAHFGIQTSHRLLERLAARDVPESREGLLTLCEEISKPVEWVRSGATLLVALYEERSGQVVALSRGDSTLATLDEAGWRRRNLADRNYLYLHGLSRAGLWGEVELQLRPGEVLALHTDGIDECHYGQPETSLTPTHIEALWRSLPGAGTKDRLTDFCRQLVRRALDGVDGHPGGQDNIALLALAHGG
jgi:hypothetical protein